MYGVQETITSCFRFLLAVKNCRQPPSITSRLKVIKKYHHRSGIIVLETISEVKILFIYLRTFIHL